MQGELKTFSKLVEKIKVSGSLVRNALSAMVVVKIISYYFKKIRNNIADAMEKYTEVVLLMFAVCKKKHKCAAMSEIIEH